MPWVLAAGQRATVRHVVTEADTAIQAGSGDVPVLGTPRLLAHGRGGHASPPSNRTSIPG